MRPDRPLAAYAPAREKATGDYVRAIRNGMDPARAAAAVLHALRAARPKPRYLVGGQSWAVSALRRVLPNGLFEAGVRQAVGRA